MENKIEKVAALEHERYVIAATAFLEQIRKDFEKGAIKSIPELLEFYPYLYNNMWKSYGQLSEVKKSYGRNWAKQLLREMNWKKNI